MSDLKDQLSNAATRLTDSAHEFADDLQSQAHEQWDSVQDRAGLALRQSKHYLLENPVPVTAAAFGLGLVVGALLSRTAPVSLTDRYVSQPIRESRGVLLGLMIAGGALLRRTFLATTTAAEDLHGELNSSLQPVKKAFRENGRKIGL